MIMCMRILHEHPKYGYDVEWKYGYFVKEYAVGVRGTCMSMAVLRMPVRLRASSRSTQMAYESGSQTDAAGMSNAYEYGVLNRGMRQRKCMRTKPVVHSVGRSMREAACTTVKYVRKCASA